VLISDESSLFCKGLEAILSARNATIVGDVRFLTDALGILRAADSDVDLLLCDPASTARTEFDMLADIKREFPQLNIIVLTSRGDPALLANAIAAGANGMLAKDISAECLCLSIELVMFGEKIFPLDRSLLEPQSDQKDPASLVSDRSLWESLSPREKQILGYLVSGSPNKKIAVDLNIAEATVKVHLKALLRKLAVENRTQAALWGQSNADR
jgi:two-component system nitrate/nitrite response regulator NarL